ncbi:MAG: PorT family protein [Bacteroidales bacterium]|nr:PorT family protein [Bacteroidales bacterium]
MRYFITLLLTISALLLGIQASAQASLGAGYAVSTDHGTNDCKLYGFYVGTSYNITYSGRVGVQPGVYYSSFKGREMPSFGFDEKVSEAVEKYINIPVLFNIGLKFSPNVFFRVYTGPVFSYGLQSRSGEPYYDDLYEESLGYDKLNLSIGVGAALEFFRLVRFEVGYENGLKDRSEIEDLSRKTDCVRAGIAFLF